MKSSAQIKAFFRRPAALFCSAGLLVSAVCGHGAWTAWSDTTALDDENGTLSARVAKADRDLAVVAAIEDDVLIQRHKLEAYSRILPDDAEINDFVEQLTRSAFEAKVQITELDDSLARNRRVRKGVQREAFARVTYRLKLAADMEGLLRFLDSFENRYARFVAFPTLSVETGSSDHVQDKKPHSVDLVLETYVYAPKSQQDGAVVILDAEERMEKLISSGRVSDKVAAPGIERYAFRGAAGRRDPFRDPVELAQVVAVSADTAAPVAATTQPLGAVDPSAVDTAKYEALRLELEQATRSANSADWVALEARLAKVRDGLRGLQAGPQATELTAALEVVLAGLAVRSEATRQRLEITGVILCAEDAPRSLALINGRGVVAGDMIEGVRVLAVFADAVELEFKGFVFRRAMVVRGSGLKNGDSH
ncbi:MAG: hypothetical protein EXS14_04210 [Planctomycetes bacterium]|nr:hypothetical protein [Planctomycetota bacterium]